MRQRGFSLLEILVAFSILALSLGILMQIFSGTTRNASLAHDQAQATMFAQSLLANSGIESPLEEGESTGVFDGRFQWRLTVVAYDPLSRAGEVNTTNRQFLLNLWQVTADVAWPDGSDALGRSISLTTVRTKPRLQR